METNNEKVISQVNQVINMLSRKAQDSIPKSLRDFFRDNDSHNPEYKITEKDLFDENLEEETKQFIKVISEYFPKEIKYEILEPDWKQIENKGDIKEAAIQLDRELAKNFFNINNKFSDRQMIDVKFIYEPRYFGRVDTKDKLKRLEPFRLLHKAFCLAHEKVEKDNDYESWLNILKEIYTEVNVQM